MRRLVAFALAFTILPLAGCLESKDHFTLNKDGSGTIVSSYDVNMPKTRELLSAMAMFMGQGDPAAIAKQKDEELLTYEHPNWFKKFSNETEGYNVKSATQRLTGEKDGPKTRETRIHASFDSLAAAAQGNAFAITAINLSKVEKSEKAPKGAWKLVVKDAFSGLDASQTGGFDVGQMLPMFESQLKKLATTIKFTIPGKILETNGKKEEDGCTASMVVTYNKIMEGKPISLTIVFEAAEGAKLTPFDHTPNLMALMPRFQQKPPVLKKAKDEGGAAEGDEGADAEKKADGETKADSEKKADAEKKADGEKKPEAEKADAGK